MLNERLGRFIEPEDKPNEWEQFVEYNRQDVVAEMAVGRALLPYPWSQEEFNLWQWDHKINGRGLPIDKGFVDAASDLVDEVTEEYLDEIAYITGVANPNSRDQVLQWLRSRGLDLHDLKSETIEGLLR